MATSDATVTSGGEKAVTKETGWDRIKQAYTYDKDNQEVPRELYELFIMTTMGMLMGYAYGGMPAGRQARSRYMEKSGAALYSSRLEAVGASYNAGTRGFIRYGYRWGWRIAILAAGFQGISSCLSLYRDKQGIANYLTAATVTGSLYRMNLGLRGMAGGAFAGLIVGTPAGLLLMGLQKLQGETVLERNKRERREKAQAREMEKEVRMGHVSQMGVSVEETTSVGQPSESSQTLAG